MPYIQSLSNELKLLLPAIIIIIRISRLINSVNLVTEVASCFFLYAGEVSAVMTQLYSTLALVQTYAVDALGQTQVYPGAPICNTNITDSNTTVACKRPFLIPNVS